MRIPEQPFHHFADGNLFLSVRPEMADSLVCPSMLLRREHSHNFSANTTMSFSTRRVNEWAGLVLYRTAKDVYKRQQPTGGNTEDVTGVIAQALSMPPILPVYQNNGDYTQIAQHYADLEIGRASCRERV